MYTMSFRVQCVGFWEICWQEPGVMFIIMFSLAYNHLKQRQTLLCFVLHCCEPFISAEGVGPLPQSRPRSSTMILQDGKTQHRLWRGPSPRQCRVE